MNLTKKCRGLLLLQAMVLICASSSFLPVPGRAQKVVGWELDKMPADLEKDLALRALPPHLRAAATVYLLDPAKGYYVAQQGSNGFVCFIARTNWEWEEFRKDVFAPMAYDPEGARTIFPIYRDVAAMRASGKLTPLQIKDSVIRRVRKGYYVAPAKGGVSYMLAPIMRVYTGKPGDKNVMTMQMPHYMFYAPYVTDSDVGTDPNSPAGPWLVNSGNTVLGERKGPEGYFIVPANEAVTAKIEADGKSLLKRLADYSPYFKLDAGGMHH
ncbi:hypothetical protein GCM10011511_48840 [Puia dinghuensis]|uniref:Uncharacterized protein n=2 Tax=Puia dinghuensis TaxID=1792502 RepID=A0A8J2UI58_9BACT|nr:hypothetical protein GCM10011511_48840 [Puia dinghuensis]